MRSTPAAFHIRDDEPIVITGIGMVASVGHDRESVWRAVRQGKSGVRRLFGLPGIPDGSMIGAPVALEPEVPGQLKVIALALHAAREALKDGRVTPQTVDCSRMGVALSGHMGDTFPLTMQAAGRSDRNPPTDVPWWHQWLPNSACAEVGARFGLHGPRLCHSTACASGLVDILSAVRSIRDGKCDIALAGSADTIHPLFAAGFQAMRVLATHDDPQQASRPFDAARNGFVMGEGAAMFVIERLGHALRRGVPIYAEIAAGRLLSEAHHVTGLDAESSGLSYLIGEVLNDARLDPSDIGYINAHGTGTQQNDVAESRGIRLAFGSAANNVAVSSVKSMLGHLVNAAGSVELGITVLALRDGFAPPTVNLTNPDPHCDLDCIPLVGRPHRVENAMKLSVAFGGHIAAVVLRRWMDAKTGFAWPKRIAA